MVKMANKLGDVAIGLLILMFVVGGFTAFIRGANDSANINNEEIDNRLTSLENSLEDAKNLEDEFTTKTDETGSFSVEDENSLLEDRGSDSAGVVNLLSKNVLIEFFKELPKIFPGATKAIAFLASIVAVIISILFLRFFWGENKI